MKVNRIALLKSLSTVWPVVGSNQLVPEYQAFTFYRSPLGNRVQATDGAMWIDSPLPEGLDDLNVAVKAEPFYELLKGMTDDEIDLVIAGEETKVLKVKAGKIDSEFTTCPSKPASTPEGMTKVDIPNLAEFIRGLDFCHYGASKDEALGAMCGVFVCGDAMWGCDRFRILRWKMEKSINLTATISTKMIELLNRIQGQIKEINYRPNEGKFTGGTLRISLEGGSELWGCTHVGEYRDLTSFLPACDSVVKMEMAADFPAVLDRHLAFQKEVPPVDKELVFTVSGEKVVTTSVTKVGLEKARRLTEDTSVKNNQRSDMFSFSVNPSLLLDAMGRCWEFSFFPEASIVLFEGVQFKYLVQTRG